MIMYMKGPHKYSKTSACVCVSERDVRVCDLFKEDNLGHLGWLRKTFL